MYKENIINNILFSIEACEGQDFFRDHGDYITTIQIFKFIVDKFNLEAFVESYNITEDEYKKYFEEYAKSGNYRLHQKIMKEFRNKEKKQWN